MNRKQKIEKHKSDVFSDNQREAQYACNKLFHLGGGFSKIGQKKCRKFLITLLDQEKPRTRNAVAITFRNNEFNAALNPLLQAINKPENSRSRGTLVYALEKLDCSKKLSELFDILFGAANNWEVQASVLTILDEQIFEFTESELQTIQEKWNQLAPSWNQLNHINEDAISEVNIDRKLIQEFVDGYLAYLK
ncbi:MAG TPA: hypothetical protein VF598_09655 [Hymenobacter sp.]|jgi:HEAT repeat protein